MFAKELVKHCKEKFLREFGEGMHNHRSEKLCFQADINVSVRFSAGYLISD